jgi:hypothetical protein
LGHFVREAALEKFCPFGLDIFLEFHLGAVLKQFLTSLDLKKFGSFVIRLCCSSGSYSLSHHGRFFQGKRIVVAAIALFVDMPIAQYS